MADAVKYLMTKHAEMENRGKESAKTMASLLKAEFYKLKKTRAFHICLAVSGALAMVMAFAIQGGIMAAPYSNDPDIKNLLAFKPNLGGAWFAGHSLAQGMQALVCAIFVSIFVSVEFNFGTMKNIVAKGFNRVQVYFSKLIVSAIASLAMLAVYMVMACVAGSIVWGFDPHGVASAGRLLVLLLDQSVLIVAYTAVFVFVAMTLRSNGAAIAVNIGLVMLFGFLLQAANLLIGRGVALSNYWLLGNIAALAKLDPPGPDIVRGIVVAAVYSIVATWAGSALFRKQDIK